MVAAPQHSVYMSKHDDLIKSSFLQYSVFYAVLVMIHWSPVYFLSPFNYTPTVNLVDELLQCEKNFCSLSLLA